MEQPTYFDGPDYPDGTDAEGFPGGDQRFGIIKPSKEEVEEIRELIVPFAGSGRLSTRFELIIRLCDAYLALREEHKSNVDMWQNIVNKLQKTCEEADREIEQLQADNRALQDHVATLKGVCADRQVVIGRSNEAMMNIQNAAGQLQDENRALKARVEILDNMLGMEKPKPTT